MAKKIARPSPKKRKYMKYGVVSAVLVGLAHWVGHSLTAAGDIVVPGILVALTAGWYTWYVAKKV